MVIQFTKRGEEEGKDQEKWLGEELKLGGTMKGERNLHGKRGEEVLFKWGRERKRGWEGTPCVQRT